MSYRNLPLFRSLLADTPEPGEGLSASPDSAAEEPVSTGSEAAPPAVLQRELSLIQALTAAELS